MKFPSVGLPKDLKHCSEVIRGVHIQCDGIELEFVKEPAVAAGLVDVTVLILALPWLFFAMGWPWPHAFHEIMRTVLVILVALVQLRMVWGFLNNQLVLVLAMGGSIALGVIGLQNWAEQNDTASLKSLPYEGNIYPPHWVAPAPSSLDRGLDELWEKAGWAK